LAFGSRLGHDQIEREADYDWRPIVTLRAPAAVNAAQRRLVCISVERAER
jgi:hypothetical protein